MTPQRLRRALSNSAWSATARVALAVALGATFTACAGTQRHDCSLLSKVPQPRWKAVSVGELEICALDDRGRVACWNRIVGMKGDGALVTWPTAHFLDGVFESTAGPSRSSGTLQLHGGAPKFRKFANELGPSGTDASSEPLKSFGVLELSSSDTAAYQDRTGVSWRHCDLDSDGRFACVNNDGEPPTVQRDVAGLSLGLSHDCLVYKDGQLRCRGGYLPLHADGEPSSSTTPPRLDSVWTLDGPVTNLDSSAYSSCAATETGSLWCWGNNWHGQVGPMALTPSEVPHLVQVPTKVALPFLVTEVACGPSQTCVLSTSGDVYCWGYGENGVLGVPEDGPYLPHEFDSVLTPKRVPFVSGVVDIDAGGTACAPYICAVDAGGHLTCWGSSGHYGSAAAIVVSGVCLDGAVHTGVGAIPRGLDSGYACKKERRDVPYCHRAAPAGLDPYTSIAAASSLRGTRLIATGRLRIEGCGAILKNIQGEHESTCVSLLGADPRRGGPNLVLPPALAPRHAIESSRHILARMPSGTEVTVTGVLLHARDSHPGGFVTPDSPVIVVDSMCQRESE